MERKIMNDDFLDRLEVLTLVMKTKMRGFFGGTHKTNTYGSTVEFADFREYVLGDDIRRIDWNLYSRFEKYFIKLFTDERQMHIQIYLDCSKSMKSKDQSKQEFALQLVAALGYLAIANMDRVSIKLIIGDELVDLCGVISGKVAFIQAISLLEEVAFEKESFIDKAICEQLNAGGNDGMSIIVSDFLTENDWKSAVDFLLYKKKEVMIAQVLSPQDIAPLYKGRTILIDCESTSRHDSKNMKLSISKSEFEAYKKACKDFLDDIRYFCDSRGIEYFYSVSDKKIEDVFFEQLYERGVIQ